MDEYNWNWSIDPEEVYQRLRKPCEVEGSATDMYEEANGYWMDFLGAMSEGKMKEAEGHLEMVDLKLQRAEIDIQMRDDPEYLNDVNITLEGEEYAE